jgi:hypothetical protein
MITYDNRAVQLLLRNVIRKHSSRGRKRFYVTFSFTTITGSQSYYQLIHIYSVVEGASLNNLRIINITRDTKSRNVVPVSLHDVRFTNLSVENKKSSYFLHSIHID